MILHKCMTTIHSDYSKHWFIVIRERRLAYTQYTDKRLLVMQMRIEDLFLRCAYRRDRLHTDMKVSAHMKALHVGK